MQREGLDDTACAPDLHHGGKVDRPVVFAVGGVDDVHPLDVACETRFVDCEAEVFEEGSSFVVGVGYFVGLEVAFEGVFDVDALGAVRGCEADEVGG